MYFPSGQCKQKVRFSAYIYIALSNFESKERNLFVFLHLLSAQMETKDKYNILPI